MKLLTNIQESYNELRYKTSWPTKSQLLRSAVIVLIASIILALIIFAIDTLFKFIMSEGVYKLPSLFS